MKSYEIMIITNISLGEDGARNVSNSIKDIINSVAGRVIDSNLWGKRKFAYEIKGATEGFYEVIKFDMPASGLAKMTAKLALMENLVRYLITVTA